MRLSAGGFTVVGMDRDSGFEPDDAGEELLLLAERRGRAGEDAVVEEAVRKAVLERTGVRPHTVVLLPPGTLPRTSSGKMRRGEALRRYLAGELGPPRRVTALAVAREMARSALAYARMRLRGYQPASRLPGPAERQGAEGGAPGSEGGEASGSLAPESECARGAATGRRGLRFL